MAFAQAQRIITDSRAPATSTTFTTDGHFSTNTFCKAVDHCRNQWDEKAGFRRAAVRSQVIDALETQEIKETGNEGRPSCHFYFSLATKRRTIHSGLPTKRPESSPMLVREAHEYAR